MQPSFVEWPTGGSLNASEEDEKASQDWFVVLFREVLCHGDPSLPRVTAVTALALRHPERAHDVYAEIRRTLIAVMASHDVPLRTVKFLWYLMDSLMKHAPHLYLPLLSPRIAEDVAQLMPWTMTQRPRDVLQTQTAVESENPLQWCERLILSWKKWLPMRAFNDVTQQMMRHVLRLEEAEEAEAVGGSEPSSSAAPTEEDMEALKEAWQGLYFTCKSIIEEGEEIDFQERLNAAASAPPIALPLHGADAGGREGGEAFSRNTGFGGARPDEDEDEDEEEYTPEFVSGAKPRELPKVDIPKERRRRDARRREREDDYA